MTLLRKKSPHKKNTYQKAVLSPLNLIVVSLSTKAVKLGLNQEAADNILVFMPWNPW